MIKPPLKRKVPPTIASPTASSAKALPKEEAKHAAEEKKIRSTKKQPVSKPEKGAGTEAEKPSVPAGQPAATRRPRRTDKAAPKAKVKREFVDHMPEPRDGQLSHFEMMQLSFAAKHELWRTLNKGVSDSDFIRLLVNSALPKEVRNYLPPAAAPSKEALWCPYCGEWMRFRSFSYTGYDRCIGCGISTKDFHTALANMLRN